MFLFFSVFWFVLVCYGVFWCVLVLFVFLFVCVCSLFLALLFLCICSKSLPRGNQVDGLPRASHKKTKKKMNKKY